MKNKTMYATEQFVQASILFAILTGISFFATADPYLMMLVCGAFMLFFTFRSFSDEPDKKLLFVQFLLSVGYIAVSGNTAAYLVFYEFRTASSTRGRWLPRLLLPSAAYFAVSLASPFKIGQKNLPHLLLAVFLLLFAALFLALAESLAIRFISAQNETARVVSMTALAGYYERKLNQELVMKNYLAEKNARLEERENISRNIHNSVGHSVTAAIVALDAARLLLDVDTERAREKIQAASRRIHAGLDSIRQAVRILDDENAFLLMEDFICHIKELAKDFMMDTACRIRMDASDISPGLFLPGEYGEFLSGAVLELLANGIRHGRADSFTIRLAADSAHIQVSVLDNGISDFSPQNARSKIENGYGLKKLLSFVEKCGGSAVFENHHGFKSVITLPLWEQSAPA